MLTVLEEVTEWGDCEYNVPNHTYLLNEKDKLIAYKRAGKGKWIELAKPMMFDKARRKFKMKKVESV